MPDELSSGDLDEMAMYLPERFGIISRQQDVRRNCVDFGPSDLLGWLSQIKSKVARENFRASSAALFSTSHPRPSFESYTNDSIYAGRWRCGEPKICEYRVCPWCRPACADRAFLDMDAIADGKLPLTAATGFGFEDIGGRPVVSSEIVKHIGQRGPPETSFTVSPGSDVLGHTKS